MRGFVVLWCLDPAIYDRFGSPFLARFVVPVFIALSYAFEDLAGVPSLRIVVADKPRGLEKYGNRTPVVFGHFVAGQPRNDQAGKTFRVL